MRDALAVYGHILLTSRKMAEAHAVFRGMQVLFPDDLHVAKSLAVTALRTGDAQSAVTIAEQARGRAEGDDALMLDLVRGKALHALGRADEARRLLEAALSRRDARPVAGAAA